MTRLERYLATLYKLVGVYYMSNPCYIPHIKKIKKRARPTKTIITLVSWDIYDR